MAAGVPVVSTTLGAEGLVVSPDKDILIADRDEDWMPHLKALSNAALWNAISAAGRDLARTRYDWEAIGDKLRQTYRDWLA
jgi:glycosyltransferase involved in cell wall biosynthesis